MPKEKIPGVSVVLLSGMGNMEKVSSDVSHDNILKKPIDPLELLRFSNSFKAHI